MPNTKRVFKLILASAIAGGILGILFAPSEGAVTREKLRKLRGHLRRCKHDDDKAVLEELRDVLETELTAVNDKLKTN